jgi:interleukin-1 receptor-associated kinase 1
LDLQKYVIEKKAMYPYLVQGGTPGYIAPELFSSHFGGVSHKSDVYSYGMMVLEI